MNKFREGERVFGSASLGVGSRSENNIVIKATVTERSGTFVRLAISGVCNYTPFFTAAEGTVQNGLDGDEFLKVTAFNGMPMSFFAQSESEAVA